MDISRIKESLQSWWYTKDSKTRGNYVKATAAVAVVSALLAMYYSSTGSADKKVVARSEPEEMNVAPPPAHALEKDVRESVQTQLDNEREKTKDEVKKMIADALAASHGGMEQPNNNAGLPGDGEDELPGNVSGAGATNSATPEAELGQTTGQQPTFSYPAAPNSTPVDGGQVPSQEAKPTWSYVGGIGQSAGEGSIEPAEPVKKSQPQIQLPVGFMRARLLVGVNALVGEFAQENPQTLMFRVQAPAQLPNSIKMNLRGCFAIANVHGNLSAERIFVFPVSMHCMTMDGRTVVEGPIKGFVSDKDGKRDMSAHVVSRASTLLASAVFAKTVEGFSNVASQDGYETSNSAIGSISTLKSGEAAKTAATKGLSGGASELGQYLLDLAKQTSPVLETGPGKDVTLFVQETATLDIKEVRIK